jgi:tetratricopeptide (TPR) repeat protein
MAVTGKYIYFIKNSFSITMGKVQSGKSKPPVKQVSKNRMLLFKVIGILSPFLFLLLLELLLRAFSYGNNLSLFIEDKNNKDYLVFNPDASKKYFLNQVIATTGNREPFKKVKDGNTTRIFVLGESTTIGYPYFHNGSFHRWLQYRLMHTFPGRNFEVVNISLTAVNSYTVLGFAKKVVNYQPDAVLIYTGHNEYYGALGVGSTENIGGSPLLVKAILDLRQLRLVQLITRIYTGIAGAPAIPKGEMKETLMKRMVAKQQIPYGSELYNRGIDQFKTNMDETLQVLNEHQIPVFISDLVSNEKDLKPFISIEPAASNRALFNEAFQQGIKAFNNNDLPTALKYFNAANHVYAAYALCNYYIGQTLFKQGDYIRAKTYFDKAKDLDALRFRAPQQINDIITQLTKKYPNTHLVDTKAEFEANSDHQIIGDSLILEHVHPNLAGYALMSDAFYESLKKEHFFEVNKENEISFKQLLKDMPITKIDSLTGVYKMANLKNSWPFTAVATKPTYKVESAEEQLAYGVTFRSISWADAMDQLYNYYINNKDILNARKVVEALILETPTEEALYEKAANLSGAIKDYDNAAANFSLSFSMAPNFDKARNLFVLYLKLDKPLQAIPYLDYAIKNNTAGFNLAPVMQYVSNVTELKKVYAADTTNIAVINKIADAYSKMGNRDGAVKYVDKALKLDKNNKDALTIKATVANMK